MYEPNVSTTTDVTATEPPLALTNDEVVRLMRALGKGQTAFGDEDVLTLVQWAQRIRASAAILDLVLDGTLAAVVQEDEVKIGLPDSGEPAR